MTSFEPGSLEDIAHKKATDDFSGLGETLRGLFKLPQQLCKTRGNCCKVATFKGTLSVAEISALSNSDEPDANRAREFLTLFEAYDTQEEVRVVAPVFVDRVREESKVDNPDKITFFKCRFLGDAGRCLIHEDRPTGCRVYPFPHENTIYHPGCGFEQRGTENLQKINDITSFFDRKLAELNGNIENVDSVG